MTCATVLRTPGQRASGRVSICLKAMARQPERRFATAPELATDLEHWLADEPVSAWHEPWTLRSRRWIGKHRTLVTAASATVLAVTVSLAVATGLLGEAYRQAEVSRQGERQARDRAEHHFNLAERNSQLAVKTYTDVVLDFQMKLSHIPAAREVREGWLQRALQGLREVGRTLETSAQAERTSMIAHAQIGDIFLTAGGTRKSAETDASKDKKQPSWTGEARWHYQRALAIAHELATAEPTSAAPQRDLGLSYHRLGDVSRNLGETLAAQEAYGQALDIFKALAKADPTDAQAQLDLGRGYHRLGDIDVQVGEIAAAHDAYRQALNIHKVLAKTDPTSTPARSALLVSYHVLGDVLVRMGQVPAAHDAYHEAVAIGQEVVQANPASAQAHRHLAVVWGKLADVRLRLGQRQTADDACRQALRISQSLAKDDPTSVEAQRYLATAYLRLGLVRLQLREMLAARDAYRQALDIFTTLAKDDPTNALAQRNLGLAYDGLGDVDLELGETQRAGEAYHHAWDILAALTKEDPGSAQALMRQHHRFRAGGYHLRTGGPECPQYHEWRPRHHGCLHRPTWVSLLRMAVDVPEWRWKLHCHLVIGARNRSRSATTRGGANGYLFTATLTYDRDPCQPGKNGSAPRMNTPTFPLAASSFRHYAHPISRACRCRAAEGWRSRGQRC